MRTTDTWRCLRREGGGKGKWDEKLTIRQYAQYLGDRIIYIPNLSIIQYTYVTNLHMGLDAVAQACNPSTLGGRGG